jgi:thiazole synthase ThiGH ThiG subunit
MEPTPSTSDQKASDNPDKLRAVTLAIARTKIVFGDRGVIELYRRMAISVLDNTRGANEIEDVHSKEYDELLGKIAKAEKETRRYR